MSMVQNWIIFYSSGGCIFALLYSTAVGNAKSIVGHAILIGATQPWLIPLVHIDEIVAISMPYYLLKRCHVKWI